MDQLSNRSVSHEELRQALGFTEQAARTFFSLLRVMEILEFDEERYRVTERAAVCLADGIATSRKPYLAMGGVDDVDALLKLLRGEHAENARPLYGGEDSGVTVMDDTDVAREIAIGLSSRARNFAEPLAAAVASQSSHARSLADIGAGSPYVALACLAACPTIETAIMVDRANGMRFVREIIQAERMDTSQLAFHEGDFFDSVPAADVYVLSNTAHDWQQSDYSLIMNHIRRVISNDGLVCIHEPLLLTSWDSDAQWVRALWMACYALTLLRITLGEGTCYSVEEHHAILASSGFEPVGQPVPTCDGCTALFYRVARV